MEGSLKGRITRIEKGCQAGRRGGRIIYHRESLYPTQIKALHLAGMHVGPSDLQNVVSLDEDRAIRKIVTALGIQDSGVPKKIACHLLFLLPPVFGTSGIAHRCPGGIWRRARAVSFLAGVGLLHHE
jgi:hypothetical protein